MVNIFTKVIIGKQYTPDYIYYRVPAPWLQVKLLKFLLNFGPIEDPSVAAALKDVLIRIVKNANLVRDQSKNHKNAFYSVLFEAIAVAVHYRNDEALHQAASRLLGMKHGN